MSLFKSHISRITTSIFTCDTCNSPLQLVEILIDEMRVQEDHFECKTCKKRIESIILKDEEVPVFSESLF